MCERLGDIMTRNTVCSILFICLFALIGFSQGKHGNLGKNPPIKPPNTGGDKIKPPKNEVTKIKPPKNGDGKVKPPKINVTKYPPKSPPVIPSVVIKPNPIPIKPSQILWTDDCDPRTDPERCSISPRVEVSDEFYSMIKSVNAKITYKIPDSLEDLATYKAVIVSFCSDENNEETLVNLIKDYIKSGGSAFILGGNICQSNGHRSSWQASQITKDFGVTFGSEDDYKAVWADVVGGHPTTSKLSKMYFSQHAKLTVSDSAESILSVNEQPIAAAYTGTGSFVALADDAEFGWSPPAYQKLGPTDNFTFWRNSLRWLISQSKIKKSKNAIDDTSAELTVYVNQKGIEIFINDEQYDVRSLKSPFKYDSLSPGTYTVRIEKSGYETKMQTVTLKHKQKLLVKFELVPIVIR